MVCCRFIRMCLYVGKGQTINLQKIYESMMGRDCYIFSCFLYSRGIFLSFARIFSSPELDVGHDPYWSEVINSKVKVSDLEHKNLVRLITRLLYFNLMSSNQTRRLGMTSRWPFWFWGHPIKGQGHKTENLKLVRLITPTVLKFSRQDRNDHLMTLLILWSSVQRSRSQWPWICS